MNRKNFTSYLINIKNLKENSSNDYARALISSNKEIENLKNYLRLKNIKIGKYSFFDLKNDIYKIPELIEEINIFLKTFKSQKEAREAIGLDHLPKAIEHYIEYLALLHEELKQNI